MFKVNPHEDEFIVAYMVTHCECGVCKKTRSLLQRIVRFVTRFTDFMIPYVRWQYFAVTTSLNSNGFKASFNSDSNIMYSKQKDLRSFPVALTFNESYNHDDIRKFIFISRRI